MADDVSKTGVFIDLKTDKVVERQPEEGIQLVAPGGQVTPAAAKRIENERAARSGKGNTEAPAAVTAPAKPAATVKR